jgi:hypothetical protein
MCAFREMMDDAIDDAMGADEEEAETDAVVQQVSICSQMHLLKLDF